MPTAGHFPQGPYTGDLKDRPDSRIYCWTGPGREALGVTATGDQSLWCSDTGFLLISSRQMLKVHAAQKRLPKTQGQKDTRGADQGERLVGEKGHLCY